MYNIGYAIRFHTEICPTDIKQELWENMNR